MTIQCKRIRVTGRVQGVFYRAFAQQCAQSLQLTGWTCNEDDGSVTVVVCGSVEKLEKFITRLHQGPPAATVENVEVNSMPVEVFVDFKIKR